MLKEKIFQLINDLHPDLLEDVESLKPRERGKLFCDLLEYGVPKLQRSENVIEMSRLSDDEVDRLFDQVLEKIKEK